MGLDLNKLEEEARRDDVPLMFDDGMAFLLAYHRIIRKSCGFWRRGRLSAGRA